MVECSIMRHAVMLQHTKVSSPFFKTTNGFLFIGTDLCTLHNAQTQGGV